jgi:uncharacterized membrane protein
VIWYFLSISLHILAAFLWIGQMIYRIAIIEPIIKRLGSPETVQQLRDIHDKLGRIGWPCLWVTVITGIFVLYYQGVTFQEFSSGRLFLNAFGHTLRAKLLLTVPLIVLQCLVGSRFVICQWLLALMGCTVIGLSTLLIR